MRTFKRGEKIKFVVIARKIQEVFFLALMSACCFRTFNEGTMKKFVLLFGGLVCWLGLMPIAEAIPHHRRRLVVCPHGVTSDGVPAGRSIGYQHGRAFRIQLTRLEGKPIEIRTAEAFLRMQRAAHAAGVEIRIVSGFRTMEHQQALYCAFRFERGTLAARPGRSNHQSGHALDLNTRAPGVLRWLNRHARTFGFRRTVPSELWHWEWW